MAETAKNQNPLEGEQAKPSPPDRFVKSRQTMVEAHMRSRDIDDPRVLEAMERVPRHRPNDGFPLQIVQQPGVEVAAVDGRRARRRHGGRPGLHGLGLADK